MTQRSFQRSGRRLMLSGSGLACPQHPRGLLWQLAALRPPGSPVVRSGQKWWPQPTRPKGQHLSGSGVACCEASPIFFAINLPKAERPPAPTPSLTQPTHSHGRPRTQSPFAAGVKQQFRAILQDVRITWCCSNVQPTVTT